MTRRTESGSIQSGGVKQKKIQVAVVMKWIRGDTEKKSHKSYKLCSINNTRTRWEWESFSFRLDFGPSISSSSFIFIFLCFPIRLSLQKSCSSSILSLLLVCSTNMVTCRSSFYFVVIRKSERPNMLNVERRKEVEGLRINKWNLLVLTLFTSSQRTLS